MSAFGLLLWGSRGHVLQQIALFVGLVVVCIGLADVLHGEEAFGGVLWPLGAGWIAHTRRGPMAPKRTGLALGCVGMLAGAQAGAFAPFRTPSAGGYCSGSHPGAALLAASLAWCEMVLLAFGTAGIFVFLPQAVQEYFGAALRGPLALFTAGVVLLAVALVSARRRDRMRQ